MHSDPIADFLIRIKNGYMAKKPQVIALKSKVNMNIAKILADQGFIDNAKEDTSTIVITLKYTDGRAALTGVKRISKPGLRVYVNKKHVPSVLKGRGVAIVSTPQGLVTDKEARTQGVGGELIAKVW